GEGGSAEQSPSDSGRNCGAYVQFHIYRRRPSQRWYVHGMGPTILLTVSTLPETHVALDRATSAENRGALLSYGDGRRHDYRHHLPGSHEFGVNIRFRVFAARAYITPGWMEMGMASAPGTDPDN